MTFQVFHGPYEPQLHQAAKGDAWLWNRKREKYLFLSRSPRLDFRRFLESGLNSRTAAGYRAYRSPVSQTPHPPPPPHPLLYNFGQNKKEQLTPGPHKAVMKAREDFGIIEMGERGGQNLPFILSKTVALRWRFLVPHWEN